jgi:signal transduction histidine kinase
VVVIGVGDGLRSAWVNGLLFDGRGRLWIGTASGINCLSADPKNPPPPSHGRRTLSTPLGRVERAAYRNTSVYSCYASPLPSDNGPRESVWLPGFHNLFCHVDGEWIVFRERSGLPATSFHTVCLDGVGRLWVGTRDNGLFRSVSPVTIGWLDTLRSEPVPLQEGEGRGTFGREIVMPVFRQEWSRTGGAPTNEIDAMLYHDGAMWVGTPAGLFVFEGDPPRVAARLSRENGLKANNVTSVALSPKGTIWIGSNAGLSEIDARTRTVLRTVTRQEGLIDNEAWFYGSVAVSGDGTVYFGTAKGLAVYSPSLDRPNATPPRLCFREIRYAEDSRGNNQLAVEYAGLSFGNEKRVRYRTRLVGYDRDWSAETADFKIRYTNLPAFFRAREYALEIMACNEDGVWTEEPLRHVFTVEPPWWFRWWALAAQLGLLGGTVYAVHSYRTRALEARNRLLETVVDARTKEVRAQAQTLQEKNLELEEKNAEIIRTQQQLIVQEKLASLGQLTAGIAHEIRNPLNFVNNFAQLSDGLIDELREDVKKHRDRIPADTAENIKAILADLEQNLARINEHGRRADGIVQGMLMHSRGQKGERRKTNLNALLEEYAQLAYHGVRASDPSVGVVFEKHLDESVGEIDLIPQDLSRVFLNIVNNACYAVHQRRAKEPDGYQPTVTLATKNLGAEVEVRIRDNGVGMPPSVREKAFNPFFTTKPTGQGTGLGLSISYDIVVQGHRVTIRVESEEGRFTEFIITLPRA